MVASMTSLFQPFDVVPHNQTKKQQGKEDEESTSSRLLSSYGIVRNAGPGSFHLLPLGLRSLAKIENLRKEKVDINPGLYLLLFYFLFTAIWIFFIFIEGKLY